MASAGLALQKALYQRLVGDTGIVAALGGPRVYDYVPRQAVPPYIAMGRSTVTDWSTGSDEGHEHVLTLHVWSTGAGHRETHELMGLVESAVEGAQLVLDGHRLVNLRHELSEARRDPDGETHHGIVRLRAVTELAG